MDISYQTLNILFFLIPGFLALRVLESIRFQEKKDTFKQVTEALLFSFFIYACVRFCSGTIPVILTESKNGQDTSYSIVLQSGSIFLILLFSILLPILLGSILNNDLPNMLLRKLHVTHSTSHQNIWLEVFSKERRWVVVNLNDGRRIQGWPMRYSSKPEDGYIYLHNPAWIDEKNNYTDLGLHGLFLVKKKYIDFIEFQHHPVTTNQEVHNEPPS